MTDGPVGHPVTLRWLNARLIVVVILTAAITSLLVGGTTTLLVQSQANKQLRANAISGCDGSNLLRGFARLAIHRFRPTPPDPRSRADWLLRIRDCEASYDRSHIVVLTPSEEVAYLGALAHRRRVAVRDGGRRFVPIP